MYFEAVNYYLLTITLKLQMNRATFDEFAQLSITTAERALNQSDDAQTLIIQRDRLDQLSTMYIRLITEISENYVTQQLQIIRDLACYMGQRKCALFWLAADPANHSTECGA